MNKTLLHHFTGVGDEQFLRLKRSATDIIAGCALEKDPKERFLMTEQAAVILDSLDVYLRNCLRMGYADEAIEREADDVCALQGKNMRLHYEAVGQLKDSPAALADDALRPYSYYLSRCFSLRDAPSLPQEDDLSSVLEEYRMRMNAPIDSGPSLSEAYASYRASADDSDEHLRTLLAAIAARVGDMEKLYLRIKRSQRCRARAFGFEDIAEHAACEYGVNTGTFSSVCHILTERVSVCELLSRAEELGAVGNDFAEGSPSALTSSRTFTFGRAMEMLAELFSVLDEDFGRMIRQAAAEYWVDPDIRRGKLSGAYTNIIPLCGKSIISMTYGGTFADVCKLAHELGHAFHGYCLSGQPYFNTEFSVITAETFGLFCETYASVYLSDELGEGRRERLKALYVGAARTYILNFLAFCSEREIFARLGESSPSPTEVYADISARYKLRRNDRVQKYEWMFRSQNFFPDAPYYDIVYLIGEAAALSLVRKTADANAVFGDIKRMLTNSGVAPTEELFRTVGIDLRDPALYDIPAALSALERLIV